MRPVAPPGSGHRLCGPRCLYHGAEPELGCEASCHPTARGRWQPRCAPPDSGRDRPSSHAQSPWGQVTFGGVSLSHCLSAHNNVLMWMLQGPRSTDVKEGAPGGKGTDLELGQWQNQSYFLSPVLPLGTLQEEQTQWVQGQGPHTPCSSPHPRSFTTAMVLPGLLVLAKEDRGTSLGVCMSYPGPQLQGALLKLSLGAVGPQHSLPHRSSISLM